MTHRLPLLVVAAVAGLALVPAGASAAIVAPNARPLAVAEGEDTGNVRVATFGDVPACDEDVYTVTIDWGDGESSEGKVVKPVQIAPDQCAYDVEGRHTYPRGGTYEVRATICRGAECVTTALPGIATVTDAEVRGEAAAIQAVAGTAFSGLIAELNDRNRESVAGDFSAIVDWGDGTPPVPAQITGTGGRFEILGNHAYRAPGAYRVLVTVQHGGRSIVLDAGSAQVTGAAAQPPVFTDPSLQATAALRLVGRSTITRASLRRSGLRARITLGTFRGTRLSYRIRDGRTGRVVHRGRTQLGTISAGTGSLRVRLPRSVVARLRRARTYALTLPPQSGLPTLQVQFRVR